MTHSLVSKGVQAVRIIALGAALLSALALAAPTPASAALCAYNSTQGSGPNQCVCPTSGPGVSCVGGQLYASGSASCYNDPRSCASNQQLDCDLGQCVCNTTTHPCGGCTAPTSTIGANCSSPAGGAYTNQCGTCGCPAGKQLCAASNTCVTVVSCPVGMTFDPCTGACGTPNVLLSPSSNQTGNITITGNISTTAGTISTGSGNISATGGDLYLGNTKAIRVDGSGVTDLNIGNWGSGSTGLSLTVSGTSSKITVPQYCIGVSCISSWPTSGVGGSGTAGTVPVFTGTGTTVGNSAIQSGAQTIGINRAPDTNYSIITDTTHQYGISATGTDAGGYFYDANNTGIAALAQGNYGVSGYGNSASNSAGGYFANSGGAPFMPGATGYAYIGMPDYGIQGYGNTAGGYFYGTNGGGEAYLGYGNGGVYGRGSGYGGSFGNTGNTYTAALANAWYAVDASGSVRVLNGTLGVGAAPVSDRAVFGAGSSYGVYGVGTNTGVAGYGSTYGVYGSSTSVGGYFVDSNNSGIASLGEGDYGVKGSGNTAGGSFTGTGSGNGVVASGATGVQGTGTTYGVHGVSTGTGGYFQDSDDLSYLTAAFGGRAAVGVGSLGAYFGNTNGAQFVNLGTTTRAISATGNVEVQSGTLGVGTAPSAGFAVAAFNGAASSTGVSGYGTSYGVSGSSSQIGVYGSGYTAVQGSGSYAGGYFYNATLNTGSAKLGYNSTGIWADGPSQGAYFFNTTTPGNRAEIGTGGYGILGYGSSAGAYFADSDTSETAYAYLGKVNYAINGGGLRGGYIKETDTGIYTRIADLGYGIYTTGGVYMDGDLDADSNSWGSSTTVNCSASGGTCTCPNGTYMTAINWNEPGDYVMQIVCREL
jgi:hypothetical protein